MRTEKLKKYYQTQFSIETIIMKSTNRSQTVANWLKWYDMDIVEESENYTDLILKMMIFILELKMVKFQNIIL